MSNRVWQVAWVTAAVVLLAIGAIVAMRLAGGLKSEPAERVLPDHGEQIEHVVCVVNTARRARLRNAPLVTGIVNALPQRVRVTILTNDRASLIVARDPNPGRVDFVELPEKSLFTIWPQDPFLVLADTNGRNLLLASAEFERADDRAIAEHLAQHLGWQCRTSELCFEGGNIVSTGRHVLIGATTIRYNAVRLEISDAEVVRRFEQELGTEVLVLGPLPQPVGHIDMAVTPLSADRLAVADPGEGARLAREQLDEHPDQVTVFERFCQEQYFGHASIRALHDREGKLIHPATVVGQTAKAIGDSETIADHLNRLAEHLEDRGYRVHRVPMLFWASKESDRATALRADRSSRQSVPEKIEQGGDEAAAAQADRTAEAAQEPEPGYPCLTYNNVLTEELPEGPVVYLPQYGWATMDEAASRAWQELGYRVVVVKGLATSAMYGGALRCCVKVIRRR